MLEIGKAKDKQAPILRGEEVVAVLSASNWKGRATLMRGDRRWNLRARKRRRLTGELSTDPVSDEGEQARFQAQQTSMWRSNWEISLEGVQYTMSSKSFWRGTQSIERSGNEVAVSGKTGRWSPRATLQAADAVPLDHQLFLLWMVFVLDRRSSNAAAAA